jgi:small subunit ribosomal protein S16
MVTIRLRRQGAKKSPFYRIVVADSRKPRDGAFVEILGHYNPRTVPEAVVIDYDRLAHWVGVGARPSDTVRSLIKRHPRAIDVDASESASA